MFRFFVRWCFVAQILRCAAENSVPRVPEPTASATTPQTLRFQQVARSREQVDRYHRAHFPPVPPALGVRIESPIPATTPDPHPIRRIRPRIRDGVARYRNTFTNNPPAFAGFKAPILENAGDRAPHQIVSPTLTPKQLEAARWVQASLATDHLLPTLASTLRILGPAGFTNASVAEMIVLRDLGFPVDLLAAYTFDPAPSPADRPQSVIRQVALRLLSSPSATDTAHAIDGLRFDFNPTIPGFAATSDSGETEVGLVRMQAGGGYHQGVVPGGVIDVMSRLVQILPQADFLISVPETVFDPFHQFASSTWPRSAERQVTLIRESRMVSSWAQDNAKPGSLRHVTAPITPPSTPALRPGAHVSLAPRFATVGEDRVWFAPSESFLMDGVAASGHFVAQSPLLFQGGNLMVVTEPGTQRRLLLVGEGEVIRNRQLGLDDTQILAAFQTELGADACIRLPAVSYHLDYDISVRRTDHGMMVFVNDPTEGARLIVSLGTRALMSSRRIPNSEGLAVLADLESRRHGEASSRLQRLMRAQSATPRDSALRNEIAQPVEQIWAQDFTVDPTDSNVRNFQEFLLGLDILEVAGWGSEPPDDSAYPPGSRDEYLAALKRLDQARARLAGELRNLGWNLIPVPSSPDLHRGINYLNGIQHRAGLIMPAFGGFFTPLDDAAETVFRRALGPGLEVIRIPCAESQRLHGGLHCLTAVYPADPTGLEPSSTRIVVQ